MNVELPGTKIGSVTITMTVPADRPENEISLCSYEGDAIDNEKFNDYYILND